MTTILKVLTIILSDRLNSLAETHELFCETQAGFRKREECVTQAACVIEILQRRKIVEKTTFATFIDFKKAYDLVPHGALFAKLARFGVRGRCLKFIKALYESSSLVIKLGTGENSVYSEPCTLRRGLRQGCPLSPVLFNIFINDLFENDSGVGPEGVRVPYGKPSANPQAFMAKGALFANDCVTLSDEVESTIECCVLVYQWAIRNEMKVGIAKCGILEIRPEGSDAQLTEDHPRRQELQIQGQLVPIVQEYVNLGLRLTNMLTIKDLATGRIQLGRKKVGALMPFITYPVLPLTMRLRVIQAVVLPTLLFGAEVYGMNRVITDSMQVLANKCYRALIGVRVNSYTLVASAPLWSEVCQKPICALAGGYWARAFQKAALLKTQI